PGPNEVPRAVQFRHKHIVAAGAGEVEDAWSGIEVGRALEETGGVDVPGAVHGDRMSPIVIAAAAQASSPDQSARTGILGHEDVSPAGAAEVEGSRTGVKIDRARENAGQVEVPRAIDRDGRRVAGVWALGPELERKAEMGVAWRDGPRNLPRGG